MGGKRRRERRGWGRGLNQVRVDRWVVLCDGRVCVCILYAMGDDLRVKNATAVMWMKLNYGGKS